MQTVRRDVLRRLCEAGRLRAVASYDFEDGDRSGGERRQNENAPVALYPASGDWRDCKPGVWYIRPGEFTTASGCAYMSGENVVTLIVHGNSNYTFRILPKECKS